jgi:L-ribulose-5-phosphate 3-epimerase
VAVNRVSFNCSNLVGQQAGYKPQNDWGSCVRAVNEYYSPLETFPARFECLVLAVRGLGFEALDIWTAGQLNWRWTTKEHAAVARELLDRHNMAVGSLGGDFGETPQEFLAACELAAGVGTRLLSGGCPLFNTDRQFVLGVLRDHDLILSIENHPEKNAREMLDKIGEADRDRVGTTVDTGWYATHAMDAVKAIQELEGRILHVHLKDVLPGNEHLNVGYGRGCVPLQECVQALRRIGYEGDFSVEEHAIDHDPLPEIAAARRLLRAWLPAAGE